MEGYVGTEEAAEILGLSRPRINQMIQRGQLPAIRVGKEPGGIWLIRREDLETVRVRPGRGRPRKKKDEAE